MAKITFANVLSGFNLSGIKANFDTILNTFQDKVLWRNNPSGEPNQMQNDLDMNSNDILNAGIVYSSTMILGGHQLMPGNVIVVDPAYPVQAGQAGKFLSTDGSNVVWAIPPNIPTCGRLSNLITNTGPIPGSDPFDSCHFIPYNGKYIFVNGLIRVIPDGILAQSGGILARYTDCYVDKVAHQTLADNTIYHIYVCDVGGNLVLNFSQTGYFQNGSTWGNAVKQDDQSSTLVGLCRIKYIGGIPTTYGGARGQTISSYFNRFRANLQTSISGTAINSLTVAKLPDIATLPNGQPSFNFLEWVQWYDSAPICDFQCSTGNTTVNSQNHLGIGINTETAFSSADYFVVNTSTLNLSSSISGTQYSTDATGYYYARMVSKVSQGSADFGQGTLYAKGVMV